LAEGLEQDGPQLLWHAASGVLDRDDYDALVQLLSAIAGAFDATVLERIQMF